MSLTSISKLDFEQVLPHSFDDDNLALRVNVVAGDITVNEAALAPQGAPAPAEGKIVAGIDGDNLVRYLRTNTNGELGINVLSSILPPNAATQTTLSALSSKTAGAFVSEKFDYADITYVGASTNISTVVYKNGGSGGAVVATLTLGYDGSNRLTSVTKS